MRTLTFPFVFSFERLIEIKEKRKHSFYIENLSEIIFCCFSDNFGYFLALEFIIQSRGIELIYPFDKKGSFFLVEKIKIEKMELG